MDNRLYIAIGAARCGKSTYGKNWLENRLKEGKKAIIANADSLRLTITGQRYVRSAEPVVHMVNKIMIADLYRRGYDLYVDETNTNIGNLKWLLEIDPDAEFIYFDTPVEECERRAISSGQPDLVDKGVIRRHIENLRDLVTNYYPKSIMEVEIKRAHLASDVVMDTLEEIRRYFKEENGIQTNPPKSSPRTDISIKGKHFDSVVIDEIVSSNNKGE